MTVKAQILTLALTTISMCIPFPNLSHFTLVFEFKKLRNFSAAYKLTITQTRKENYPSKKNGILKFSYKIFSKTWVDLISWTSHLNKYVIVILEPKSLDILTKQAHKFDLQGRRSSTFYTIKKFAVSVFKFQVSRRILMNVRSFCFKDFTPVMLVSLLFRSVSSWYRYSLHTNTISSLNSRLSWILNLLWIQYYSEFRTLFPRTCGSKENNETKKIKSVHWIRTQRFYSTGPLLSASPLKIKTPHSQKKSI